MTERVRVGEQAGEAGLAEAYLRSHGKDWPRLQECADVLARLLVERDAAKRALSGCIPWVATSGRGAAQEALAVACKIVGSDPYDWSSHPEVLTARMALLGYEDRRASTKGGALTRPAGVPVETKET